MKFIPTVLLINLFVVVISSCSNNEGCSLNGNCVNGACVCNSGWTDSTCSSLTQLPMEVNSEGNFTAGYVHSNYSSWGGSVIYSSTDKMYHMFVSQFTNGCNLSSWETNSFIMEAISPTPQGPYKPLKEVLPVFHHNPTVTRAPDGTYLLYFIGEIWNGTQEKCEKGNEQGVQAGNTGIIGIAYSSTLNGSWSLLNGGNPIIEPQSWFTHPTNPSGPVFLEDGSVYLAFRGSDKNNTERLGMLYAPSWKGPYSLLVDEPIVPGWGEDPYLWRDKQGNFHILFHARTSGVGGHAYSSTGKSWTLGTPAYTTTSKLSNGKTFTFGRRERPHLILDTNNNPAYLFNGATNVPGLPWSYTIAVQLT